MISCPRRWAIDFHAHTSYSHDCALKPRTVIEIARRRGLDGIAITDHETEKGGLATIEANPYRDFLVIPGVEIKTDVGDVIGLYITRPIKSRKVRDVIAEITHQGGFTYVPHPLRSFPALQEIYSQLPADAWEVFNGRYTAEEMLQSRLFFEQNGAGALLAGSDSHFPWEIGICRTELDMLPQSAAALKTCLNGATSAVRLRSEFSRKVGIYTGAFLKAKRDRRYDWLMRECLSLPCKAARYCARGIINRYWVRE